MDKLKEIIGDLLEDTDGLDIDTVTEIIITELGIEIDPNIGPNNEMIRFQTKWFDR